jgi:hypothetical protein
MNNRIHSLEVRLQNLTADIKRLEIRTRIYLPSILLFCLGCAFVFSGAFTYDPGMVRVYNNGILWKKESQDYVGTSTTTGGAGDAVFYLTKDGTSTGTAIYPNAVNFVSPRVNDATTQYLYGWTLSPDRKTLTVKVNKTTAFLLGIIQVTGAANGVSVNVLVKGN